MYEDGSEGGAVSGERLRPALGFLGVGFGGALVRFANCSASGSGKPVSIRL